MATLTTKKYNNSLCYKFDYTITKTTIPGRSKVEWKFYSTGGSSSVSPTWAYSNYDILVTISSGSLYSGTLPDFGVTDRPAVNFYPEKPSYNGKPIVDKSGTFYITHNSSGAASLKVVIKTSIYTTTTNTLEETIT